MSDTTLFDILRAFQVRDTSDAAEIRALTDRDITRAIERHHARQFKQTRVLARTHQEILVFVKGDRKKAAKRLGDVDVSIDLQEAVAEMERENDAAGEAAA